MTDPDPTELWTLPPGPDALSKLREKFPPESVGKLPRISCNDCSKAQAKVCPKHKKQKCGECGNYISTAHLHLDYVGHAETTDRLLNVDPEWNWEPFALDANGLPALDREGNLWIRLTIAGVTRPGVGDGPDMKQRIGDAIRNGAMRFGVALDLWAKSDLESQHDQGPPAEPKPSPDFAVAPDVGPTTNAEPLPLSADPCLLCGDSLSNGKPLARWTDGSYVHTECKKAAQKKAEPAEATA